MSIKVLIRPDEVIDVAAVRIGAAVTDLPSDLERSESVAAWLAEDLPHRIELLQQAIHELCAVVELLTDLERQTPHGGEP